MFDSIRKYGRFAQPFGTGEWYPVNADGSTSRVLELAKKGSIEVPDYSRFSVLDNPQNDEGTILMPMNAVTPRCWRRRAGRDCSSALSVTSLPTTPRYR